MSHQRRRPAFERSMKSQEQSGPGQSRSRSEGIGNTSLDHAPGDDRRDQVEIAVRRGTCRARAGPRRSENGAPSRPRASACAGASSASAAGMRLPDQRSRRWRTCASRSALARASAVLAAAGSALARRARARSVLSGNSVRVPAQSSRRAIAVEPVARRSASRAVTVLTKSSAGSPPTKSAIAEVVSLYNLVKTVS